MIQCCFISFYLIRISREISILFIISDTNFWFHLSFQLFLCLLMNQHKLLSLLIPISCFHLVYFVFLFLISEVILCSFVWVFVCVFFFKIKDIYSYIIFYKLYLHLIRFDYEILALLLHFEKICFLKYDFPFG